MTLNNDKIFMIYYDERTGYSCEEYTGCLQRTLRLA